MLRRQSKIPQESEGVQAPDAQPITSKACLELMADKVLAPNVYVYPYMTKWKHWILRQPDQVSKTETMARGGTKPYLWQPVIASQSSNKGWKSHRQLFRPDWGSSVWRTDGQCRMTGCF